MSDEQKASTPEPALPPTKTCNRCKRQMFVNYLATVDGKSVCNLKNRTVCNRLAGERKPRAKVGE